MGEEMGRQPELRLHLTAIPPGQFAVHCERILNQLWSKIDKAKDEGKDCLIEEALYIVLRDLYQRQIHSMGERKERG